MFSGYLGSICIFRGFVKKEHANAEAYYEAEKCLEDLLASSKEEWYVSER